MLVEFGTVRGGGAGGPVVPGSLKSHYAPVTPVTLVGAVPAAGDAETAVLLFRQRKIEGYRAVENLSAKGDLREAAANLYGALRRLDASGARRILAERVPAVGVGLAIRERLQKAAVGS